MVQQFLSLSTLWKFSLFFDNGVIELIVRDTNRYVAQCKGDDTWETTADEIHVRAYLGFQILMGINQLPEIRYYWVKDERLHYAPITDRISHCQFEEVSHYLYFVDNTTLPKRGEDRYQQVQKILLIIAIIKEWCFKVYRPKVQNSIDEAIILFKGEY